jgi:hypothetical protein
MKLRLTTSAGSAALLTWMAVSSFPSAFASAAQTRHHYDITGGLTPVANTAVGSAPTHFSAHEPQAAQAGDGFELSARLVAAPDGCYADTIFRDGFDP